MGSFRSDNAAKQTEFRLAALANGYTPIPNHDKRCFVKSWSTMPVDEHEIAAWSRKLSYQATGIRVQDGLCAIDIDIDDEAIVTRIWDRATEAHPQLREALVRFGNGAKELWLCRTDEEFSVIFSTSHVRPGEDPEEDDVPSHRLEAFGGGHPRQIGSYGAHTMKDDGSGFAVEYTWAEDESPADVALSALPVLSKSNVLHLASIAQEEMEAKDWPRVRRSRSGESDTTVSYDLTNDMVFDCLDGVTRKLSDLTGYAESDRNARCSAAWMGDPKLKNRTRCLVGIDHDGVVSVLETASWTRHLPADQIDREKNIVDRAEDLRAKMEEAGIEFDFDTYHDAPASFQDKVFELIDDWAWCGSHTTPCLPIGRAEELGMNMNNLRMTYIRHSYEREGPRGGVQKISPVDAWVQHVGRQDVDGYRYMPHRGPGVYTTTDDIRAINSYRAPMHVTVDGPEASSYVSLWLEFMEHLLPIPAEREWFLDWLAHKAQNPTVPGVAVLMVAKSFGVGRGTLFEIVGGIFGDHNVKSVTANSLLGNGSQSQYTDWLANTLFVTTDEVLPDGDDGASMAWRRKKAYEHLKERVDPKPRRADIIRKTLPNYNDWIYASFLLATNHENALPIPKDDRRFVILTNSEVPLRKRADLYRRLNVERNPEMNPRFASALSDWLMDRDVSAFDAHDPPLFDGKARMLEANVTELEGIVEDVLETMPHEWAALDAILYRVENELTRKELKDAYPNWRKTATDKVKNLWHFAGRQYVDKDRKTRAQIMLRDAVFENQFKELKPEERADQYADMRKLESRPSAKIKALRAGLSEV